MNKPLGHRAYGTIPHLIGSKRGPGDKGCDQGMHRICTEQARDKHDLIIVLEKLDGSNVAVAKIDGEIVALTRAGYTAETSPHEQHHYFAGWVNRNLKRFDELLSDGERVSGEWLLQAHGTRYRLFGEPFVAFDLWTVDNKRMPFVSMQERVSTVNIATPFMLHMGGPISIGAALNKFDLWWYTCGSGAIDLAEGAVWRVERKGVVDFLAKYVRHEHIAGKYMFCEPPIWNTYEYEDDDVLGIVDTMDAERRAIAIGESDLQEVLAT